MLKMTARDQVKRLAVIFTVLVAALLLTGSGAMYASAPAAPVDIFTCVPTGIAAFNNRVHVRCSPAAPGGITYFAVCTASDSASASRFLSVFTTAKVTSKNIVIFYTPSDTSGAACGCAAADCRVIWGAEVQP